MDNKNDDSLGICWIYEEEGVKEVVRLLCEGKEEMK